MDHTSIDRQRSLPSQLRLLEAVGNVLTFPAKLGWYFRYNGCDYSDLLHVGLVVAGNVEAVGEEAEAVGGMGVEDGLSNHYFEMNYS